VNSAAEMLKRSIRLLAETRGDAWINKASVWHMIKRLDPTFDTRDHGYANFPVMVMALGALVEVLPSDSDHLLRLR